MKYYEKVHTVALFIVATVTLNACFSYSPDEYSAMNMPSTTPDTVPAEVVQEKQELEQSELMSFIQRLSLEEASMLTSDQDLLDRLPKNIPSKSLLETAVAIGLVAKWHTLYRSLVPQISETDLDHEKVRLEPGASREDPSEALLPSLEELARQKNFDIAQAVEENALLGSYQFQKRLLFALTHSMKQTPEFVNGIRKALQSNSMAWEQIQGEFPSEVKANFSGVEEVSEDSLSENEGEIAPPLEFGSDTFVNDEAVLKEAQDLRDQGEYSKAIVVLKTLGEGSPFNAAAIDSIRDISNIGVQDLRRKAARAFQSAKPINDKKTKAAYLRDAKAQLEKALEVFPDADQINTVKQNLEVIKRSLNALNEQIKSIENRKKM